MKLCLQFISGTTLECELNMKNPTIGDLKAELVKLMAKKHFAQEDPFGFLGQEVKNKALKHSKLMTDLVASKIQLVYAARELKGPNDTLLSYFKLAQGTKIYVILSKTQPEISQESLLQRSFKALLKTAPLYGTHTLQKTLKNENNNVVVDGAVTVLNDLDYKKF